LSSTLPNDAADHALALVIPCAASGADLVRSKARGGAAEAALFRGIAARRISAYVISFELRPSARRRPQFMSIGG
jgi:hypothetical protein